VSPKPVKPSVTLPWPMSIVKLVESVSALIGAFVYTT